MSEAGSEISRRQCLAAFAASVSACANVNCVSNVPAGKSAWAWSCNCLAYATHSSIRMRHGPQSLNSSRNRSPGLVAFSSSAATREYAFLASLAPPACAPSCQASSPHNVRTTVRSDFVTGLPGEILLPTSTTRFVFGRVLTPASATRASIPARLPGSTPEKR